jgi:hypothetical protein
VGRGRGRAPIACRGPPLRVIRRHFHTLTRVIVGKGICRQVHTLVQSSSDLPDTIEIFDPV